MAYLSKNINIPEVKSAALLKPVGSHLGMNKDNTDSKLYQKSGNLNQGISSSFRVLGVQGGPLGAAETQSMGSASPYVGREKSPKTDLFNRIESIRPQINFDGEHHQNNLHQSLDISSISGG